MPTGYRDLHIYDAPGVALSQLAGGRFSLESLADTVLSPERLAPEDRKTMSERLLDEGGGVGSFLVNTLTNPFVLAMLFTHAPVAKALGKGRDPFLPAAGRGSLHKEWNPLAAAGLLGINDATMGGHAATTVGRAVEAMKDMHDGITSRVGVKLAKLMEALGVDTFDIEEVAARYGAAKAAQVADVKRAAMVRINRMEKAYAPTVVNAEAEYGIATKGPDKKWTPVSLGRSDDPAAVKKYLDAKTAREAWEQKRNELARETKIAKERGTYDGAYGAQLRDEWKALNAEEPALHWSKITAKAGEKPAFEMKWTPDGKEDSLAKMASTIEERMGPEYHDWLKSVQDEMVARKNGLFQPEGGLPSDKAAMRILRSVQQRREQGVASIMGPTDSAVGSFGKWGGDEAMGMLFGQEHRNAMMVGATTEEEGLTALKQMIAGGDSFSDHYIPFNSFERVTTEAMKANPRLKPANTRILRAFDEDGMHAGMTASRGVALSKKGAMPTVHPEDLKLLASSTDLDQETRVHLWGMIGDAERSADHLLKTKQVAMPALRIDPFKSTMRYLRETGSMEVMLADAHPSMLQAQAASVRNAKATKGWEQPHQDPILQPLTGGGPTPRLDDELHASDRTLLTNEAMLRNAILQQPDRNVQGMLRESFAGLTGRGSPEGRVMRAAMHQAKAGVASFMGTKLGGWLAENVPPLGRAMTKMADPDSGGDLGKVGSGLARLFYMSHLGLNAGSMMVNLMQPAVMTMPMLGARNTLIGYKRAAADMWKYAEARVARHGLGLITPSQRQAILDEVLPHAREWGIGGDHLSTLDAVTFGENLGRKRGFFDKVEEVFLKGFEKTEWLNRMVTGHAVEAGWEVSGKPKTPAFYDMQKRFIATTQFTNSPENTPQIFLTGKLSHPVLRQFMSFPLRTMTGVFHTAPMMAGQGSYAGGLANTVIRGLGMSAILYEAGKSLAGVDLSRGLFAASATDLFGGDKYLESGNGWVKLPPIISVPHDLISGFAQGDAATLSNAVARLVPGGLAFNRMIGVMPEVGLPVVGAMQKTSAEWGSPLPDGRVPVYKGGRLVDYKSPTELVMRGLGVDMGRFNEPGSLDGYLVKQREEILAARQEYLRAMAANDPRTAEGTARAFEEKFGVPLTVSREQVRAFVQSRQVPRTERILDRLPSEVRAGYAGVVGASRGLNVPTGSLAGGGTSRSRAAQRTTPGEDVEAAVRRAMEEQLKGSQQESMAFTPFGS